MQPSEPQGTRPAAGHLERHYRLDMSLTAQVDEALASHPLVRKEQERIELSVDAGALVMRGEVSSLAVKKLALERAAAVWAPEALVDQLRVVPAMRMTDAQVRDHVRDALDEEPTLRPFSLRADGRTVRDLGAEARGLIEIRVEDGVVTLDGEVSSLAQKRLAGVLAWWVPGTRDVVNGLGVSPAEEDRDEEVTDAVDIVLEKDPLIDTTQIGVHTQNRVVTLSGSVPTQSERELAERDTWYVFGVDRVENQLSVGR